MELCICAIIDKAGKKQYGAFVVRRKILMMQDGRDGLLHHELDLDFTNESLEEVSHVMRVRLVENYGIIVINTKKPGEFYIVNRRPDPDRNQRIFPNILEVWKCEDLDQEETAIVHKHLIQQVNWIPES